jgi:hypothetical protein
MLQKNIRLKEGEWAEILAALECRLFDLQYAGRCYELYGDYEGAEEVVGCAEARRAAAQHLALIRKISRQL